MTGEGSADINELLRQLADGKQTALKALHQAWSDKLFQFALSVVHIREMAEEVVQDVFLQLWQRRATATDIRELRLYLFVATRNTAISHLRRQQKAKIFSLDEIHLPYLKLEAGPEEQYLDAEMLHRINLAINNLPLQCKLIFKLVRQDGFSYKEAAELLQLSPKTVENQLGIAVKKIHLALRVQPAGKKNVSGQG